MTSIYKYKIWSPNVLPMGFVRTPEGDRFELELPETSVFRYVGDQNGKVHVWYEVPVDQDDIPKKVFIFEVFATGVGIREDMGVERKFLGSVQTKDGLVLHVFERIG